MAAALVLSDFLRDRQYPGDPSALTRAGRTKAAAILLWPLLFTVGAMHRIHFFSVGVWLVLVAAAAGGLAILYYRLFR
jgi:hypothetical protein